MIFRLSEKLAKKIDAGKRITLSLDENPFADWSSHVFTADRVQYILLSNTKSLYSCVMVGRGITHDGLFLSRALETIRDFMEAEGQAFVYQKFIAPASETVTFAKALNRSVTGSINELILVAKHMLTDNDVSLHAVALKLNDFLLSALATEKASGYGTPNEAFARLMTDLK